jgi:hypothetical protein
MLELLEAQTASQEYIHVEGPILSSTLYVDFSTLKLREANGEVVATCPAVIGTLFLAGTEDGRGPFGLQEGNLRGKVSTQESRCVSDKREPLRACV